MRRGITKLMVSAGLLSLAGGATGQSRDTLKRGFQTPPHSARPRVWWHWMNGNITKEGIKLDLEWMHRVGIGGFQNFDANLITPQVVDKRLIYMTPEWKDAFRYAASLADKLGLEMAIAGSPGWSESGGPWVPPAQGMKKAVWSETRVEGGKPFTGTLPKPPSVTGAFQTLPKPSSFMPSARKDPEYYADSAVIAFRVPDTQLAEQKPTITSNRGNLDVALLSDGELLKATSLPAPPKGEQSWIQFEYPTPQTIYALTIVTRGVESPFGDFIPAGEVGQYLQVSSDGVHFTTVGNIPGKGLAQHTIAFPKTTGRFFRVAFDTPPPTPNPFGDSDPSIFGLNLPPPPKEIRISELVLHTSARVNRFEEKAGFATLPDLSPFTTPQAPKEAVIVKDSIVDLTSKMRPDGSLDWTPPAGQWKVLRFGYSLTGHTNSPASPEATGLEVDKLNRNFVKSYLDTYLGMYKDTVGELMGKRGLQYMITDSWEAGVQNWTDEIVTEFTKRRGYSPLLWLPTLAGYVIESSEASDGFLWDFRKTLGDLVTEYHYDQISESLKQRGMGRYSESHESGRAFIGDGMEVKRGANVPMSAMWTTAPGVEREQYGYNADIRESASVAHLYGQNLVAAESLTAFAGGWSWSPETLKSTADKELAMGLNRFVIHTSVHQPLTNKTPGLGLGPFGQWFNRNETWAEPATAWVSYLSRCSYLLQQGHFVADILYYYGEDSNITALFSAKSPDIPVGYNFDYVNADALTHIITAKHRQMTTQSGMSYRVLALDPNSRQMSLPVLRKIVELAKAGVVIVGAKPTHTPSLADNQAEFNSLVAQVWRSGRRNVYESQPLAEVMNSLKLSPDFTYSKPKTDTNLLFVHRKAAETDLYFVDNRSNRTESLETTFRVEGRTAELWHPETGKIEPISYQIAEGRTTIPLTLAPFESVFVVFRKPTTETAVTIPTPQETLIKTLDGAWNVSFQSNRGAPAQVKMDTLASWSESADAGVKYFSGTGTYTKTVKASAEWFKSGARVWLDLGSVKNIAEVSVNGKKMGIVWKTPFKLDITDALKPGNNLLSIAVTNLWVNRLIGDLQPNATQKYTFTVFPFYKANSPLLPSGLLGQVRLWQVVTP